jgi:hypothetical protein
LSVAELEDRRAYELRLDPDRALRDLDDAHAFLRDRGMLTLTAGSTLPSVFGAVHEEPYAADKRGFAQWPKTKWWWGGALGERSGVYVLKLHRGKDLYLTEQTVALAAPLCRAELDRAAAGEHGADAERLVAHLAEAGPSALDELKEELALDTKRLRGVRDRLERVGAIASRGLRVDTARGGHRHTSELLRFDQLYAVCGEGGLGELLAAGVRAAVVAPESEARRWFSWPVLPALVDELVEGEKLLRPEPGWLATSPASGS